MDKSVFYKSTMIIQILVYIGGTIELFLESQNRANKYLKLLGYFVAMIYASFMAFIMFLKGTQYATWNTIREEK